MIQVPRKQVALIVAHPDDETLWAGGTILTHPSWECFIVCLCRGSDPKRAPRFEQTLVLLRAEGIMGDLDDGPEQIPIPDFDLQQAILQLLPDIHFDLIITHHPAGEYTRHLRHEETSKAVIELWYAGKIRATTLWFFAFEDGGKAYFPKAIQNTSICHRLSRLIWLKKYRLITKTYGFDPNSWEALTTPSTESFWEFSDPKRAAQWLNNRGVSL